jgi:hypothetical protein
MSMSLESIANPLAIEPNIYTLASGNSKKVNNKMMYLSMSL